MENSENLQNFSNNSATNDTGSAEIEDNQGKINEIKGENNAFSLENLLNEENISQFSKDYPEIDINKLTNRQEFQAFLALLSKNPTLSQIYACFNEISSKAEENTQGKLLQALANAKAGVGSLSSSESQTPYFTREQVLRMSPEQIKANFSQIRKSQERW